MSEAATTADVGEPSLADTNRTEPRKAHRIATGIAVVAIVAHVLLAWFGRPSGLETGQDDAEYVILARSLRSGGYEELHRVDRPVHAQYPPGYPALIAAWSTVTGDGFDALVVLNVVLSAAALVVLRRALRKRGFGEVVATGSIVALAVNPSIVAFAGSAMSETSYILLTMFCLMLLADDDPGVRRLAVAGGVAILAALTRSIGVTLLAALGAHWLLERRWKSLAALVAVSAVTVGAWLLWTMVAPEQYIGSSYVADLRVGAAASEWAPGPLRRVPTNVAAYAGRSIPWLLALPSVPGTPLDNVVIVLALAVLGGVGVWVFARRWRLAALYLGVYGGLLAVWVWKVDRFVVPLLPLIVPVLLAGADAIAGRLRIRRRWLVPSSLALFLAGGAAARTIERVAATAACDRAAELPDPACLTPDQVAYFDAVRWIRTRTPDDAVLLASKSAPLWLYTGRQSVGYATALSADSTTLLPFLREQGAELILLGTLQQAELWQLAPLLRGVCGQLVLEATFPPDTYIFRTADGAAPDRSGAACGAIESYLERNEGRRF